MSNILTRERLAELVGVTPRTIKAWTSESPTVFSPVDVQLSGRGSQTTYEYSPRALMVAQLMVELGEIFGSDNSPLPKRVVRAIREQLDRLDWDEGSKANLIVDCGRFTITMKNLSFIRTAKEKYASL